MNYLLPNEEIQELHEYVRRGEAEEVTAEFNSSNQLVVTGSGSIKLKVDVRWNDNPSTAGTAFDTLSVEVFLLTEAVGEDLDQDTSL